MNDGYALRYLGRVMNWNFQEDIKETIWLRLMSDFKYDGYRDFLAGSRFPEALLNWLQQFDEKDRALAYRFFRERLIFVSWTEINQLVHRTLPVFARNVIVSRVAEKTRVPSYLVWADSTAREQIEETLRRTLFIGLSDGARIDAFRRANVGRLSNEQVTLSYEMSAAKWRDLHDELRKRTGDQNATFDVLFLIDDFMGSGKTLLRQERDGAWKGKLKKFASDFTCQRRIFSEDCTIAVHHYIGTYAARQNLFELLKTAEMNGPKPWFPGRINASFDLILSPEVELSRTKTSEFEPLIKRYYDSNVHLKSKSFEVGGSEDARYGFADCGLPLVIEHNTPNNSLALIWAESDEKPIPGEHAMRPLFRRRQRHS